jgi:hypothetical protein
MATKNRLTTKTVAHPSQPVPSLSGVSLIAKNLRHYRGLWRDRSVFAANIGPFFGHHLLIL